MDPVRNPYSPGAGVRPPELAGRERELADFDVLMGRAEAGRPAQGLVLHGLRGVGKTVLLGEFAEKARRRSWIVATIEARRDPNDAVGPFRARLATALNESLREVTGSWGVSERFSHALRAFRSFSLSIPGASIGIAVDPLAGVSDSGDLELDLTELARNLGAAAVDRGVGVLVVIDEMQDVALADLGALCGAAHASGQRGIPFFVVGAGLPNLPGRLAEARSYAERLYTYRLVGALEDSAARDAIVLPASQEGAAWQPDAVDIVVRAADGFPYFLQEFGKATWNVAADDSINRANAEDGIRIGLELLDTGFYRSRWSRATPGERRYLAAMAEDGEGPSSSGDIARRLGTGPNALGPVRAKLISKGLVYSPEHGLIEFTVPGMARFIGRQSEVDLESR